jgi:hypothetical protein
VRCISLISGALLLANWEALARGGAEDGTRNNRAVETIVAGGPIRPTVEIYLQRNSINKHIVLFFRVGNRSEASGAIVGFGAYNMVRPRATQRPPQWVGLYGLSGNDSSMAWACIDTTGKTPAGWSEHNFWPTAQMILPGDTTRQFAAVLTIVPRRLHVCAWAFDTLGSSHFRGGHRSIATASWDREVVLPAIPPGRTESGIGSDAKFLDNGSPLRLSDNQDAAISYGLPKDGVVDLLVVDTLGVVTRRLVKGTRTAGLYVTLWDGANDLGRACDPGVYACRLRFNGKEVGARKVTLSH